MWYGIVYAWKKWYDKCHTSHTTSAALEMLAYQLFALFEKSNIQQYGSDPSVNVAISWSSTLLW